MKKNRSPPAHPPPDYSFALVGNGPKPPDAPSASAEEPADVPTLLTRGVSLWFVNHTATLVTVHASGRAVRALNTGPLHHGDRKEATPWEVGAHSAMLIDDDLNWASDLCLAYTLEFVTPAGMRKGSADVWMDYPYGLPALPISELGREGWPFRVELQRG